MAKDLDLPILPVTISGANKIMPANSLMICPNTIDMTIHEPIEVSRVDSETVQELSHMSKLSIASSL